MLFVSGNGEQSSDLLTLSVAVLFQHGVFVLNAREVEIDNPARSRRPKKDAIVVTASNKTEHSIPRHQIAPAF